ncbi:MAG TPA: hypothetical protein PKY27_05200, partial [Arachnia sp.]|nr:hypothetical protein [Arachnia sp.]
MVRQGCLDVVGLVDDVSGVAQTDIHAEARSTQIVAQRAQLHPVARPAVAVEHLDPSHRAAPDGEDDPAVASRRDGRENASLTQPVDEVFRGGLRILAEDEL